MWRDTFPPRRVQSVLHHLKGLHADGGQSNLTATLRKIILHLRKAVRHESGQTSFFSLEVVGSPVFEDPGRGGSRNTDWELDYIA